jgi:hypothetical protein
VTIATGPSGEIRVPVIRACHGTRWWSERHQPKGWRCWTCHPPVHLPPEAIQREGEDRGASAGATARHQPAVPAEWPQSGRLMPALFTAAPAHSRGFLDGNRLLETCRYSGSADAQAVDQGICLGFAEGVARNGRGRWDDGGMARVHSAQGSFRTSPGRGGKLSGPPPGKTTPIGCVVSGPRNGGGVPLPSGFAAPR